MQDTRRRALDTFRIQRTPQPTRAPPEIVDRGIPPSPLGYGGQTEPWLDDPFPDYDTEPVYLSSVLSAIALSEVKGATAEALA